MRWLIYLGLAVVAIPVIVVMVGAALPKAHVVSATVQFRASPSEIFAIIAGPSTWRGVKYEPLSQTPLQWRETDSSGDAITYERVETIEPQLIVNRIADPKLPFGGSWTYEIKPNGTGTELTITENGEVYNPLFRFVSRFIMGHTASIKKYVVDLKSRLKE